ncbi:MAG: O-acetylhomoserine aminocarboxypropyltransferase/cysteine synthase [Firmicutes bacterium]|nr:O-acetylhomoserine aminocarboxypropyltransferase/cysteine synthase [Blautia sp.]MDD7372069.1 O-acetylhomoserine aminocarboxypropyltransferase/cysteine synthase [Bacillota bacterium]MDY3714689.1 O-acetylhomoserine aminocarboxypropyltransferase/cysteine synthase family protein [Blautia sp.]
MGKELHIETKCVHSGWQPKKGEPRMMPIYQSTTFKYDTTEAMGRMFDLKDDGYFYTRCQNPTNDLVAKKIADLEGGVAGVLTSSGQAATFYAVFNICEAGDHVICASAIYGGTLNLLGVTAKKMGIECTFVDADASEEELAKAFQPNTKAVLAETISNPALVVLDIEKFAKLAHEHGVPLIVDNTFATPVNCRPFEWGADIVTHSTTKYMDGHAMQVGGAIVDSGNFDWEAYGEKFHGLTKPDESYHGIVYTKQFGKAAYIAKINAQLMRDLGSIPSPMNCFLLNASLESLPLRVERHCYNAQKVAEFLNAHPLVEHVNFAGLPGDKYHEMAKKYMPKGTCGVISFELKGGREAAVKFMDSLKLASIVTHVADAKTSVLHPASHTHRQLNDEQLVAAGISPGMVRFSVGIENIEDIIDDLTQALEASEKS